jgi:hypothetical protein
VKQLLTQLGATFKAIELDTESEFFFLHVRGIEFELKNWLQILKLVNPSFFFSTYNNNLLYLL